MGEQELVVQGGARVQEHHSRTAPRRVPAVRRSVQLDHAEPEPAESVPGEPEVGRRGVRRAAEQERVHAPGRGAGGAASRVRYDDLAERHPERGSVRAVDVHRLVERPEPEAKAFHAFADIR